MAELRLSQLIGAFSYALDLTDGQPGGHSVRCCWIGMHVGRQLGLGEDELWSVYYAILLKDLGCSSNAARICELYATDDRQFKHDFKLVGTGLPHLMRFVVRKTGPHLQWRQRLRALAHIARNGDRLGHELMLTRCTRGADIARQLRFPESVALAVHSLDEHFDGGGQPAGLRGQAIPLGARLALLAQVVDVFHFSSGPHAALAEARARAGGWFDPELVRALEHAAAAPGFWQALADPDLPARVQALEPDTGTIEVDEDYLDDIATAFGGVVDAKSPFTAGHSTRVAHYTDRISLALGLPDARRRWLRRGALLHDVGKLGVSNTILDKPARLDADEWDAVRLHARYTHEILARIPPFEELAGIASAHHERLDGAGYPLGLGAEAIGLETRIITAADIFDAITAQRPYHGALDPQAGLAIMRGHVGTALDPACFAALEAVVGAEASSSPRKRGAPATGPGVAA